MNNVTSLKEHRTKVEKKALARQGLEPMFGAFLAPCKEEHGVAYKLCVQTPNPETQVVVLLSDDDAQIIESEANDDFLEDDGTLLFTIRVRKAIFHHEFYFIPTADAIQCVLVFHSPLASPERERTINFAWTTQHDL